MMQQRTRRNIVDKLFVALCIGIVYLPVVTVDYAFTDDFRLYFSGDNLYDVYMSAGRPVLALTWQLTHLMIERVSDLRILRFIAVIGCVLLGLQVQNLARLFTASRIAQVATAIGLVALPGITVFAAWATCYLYPFSALLALLAASYSWQASRQWQKSAAVVAVWRIGLSSLLLILSAAIYQPTASWFWIYGIAACCSPRFGRSAQHRKSVILFFAAGVMQFVLLFILLKLFLFVGDFDLQERGAMLQDPWDKLQTFARIQAPLALNQWQVVDVDRKWLVALIGLAVSSLIAVGFYLADRRQRSVNRIAATKLLFLRVACVVFALLCSHAHWFATAYHAKNYRSVTALTAAVGLLLIWSLLQIVCSLPRGQRPLSKSSEKYPASLRPIARKIVFAIVILIGIGKASTNLHRYWIVPYTNGFQFLVGQLAGKVNTQTTRIHIIRQQAGEGPIQEKNIYNYGRPFSDLDADWTWGPPALVRAGLIDASKLNSTIQVDGRYQVTSSVTGEPLPGLPPSTSILIDMRELAGPGRASD
jgi:hypothetical protein